MTFVLALALASVHPAVAQASPPAAPVVQPAPLPPCAVKPRFVAVAIDPMTRVDVNATQQFAVALRVVADAGYSWRLVEAPPPNSALRAEGSQIVPDVAFANLDRKAGDPPRVGGEATELFLFSALQPGDLTLTFGLFRPGGDNATRTAAYAVHVSPNVAVPVC